MRRIGLIVLIAFLALMPLIPVKIVQAQSGAQVFDAAHGWGTFAIRYASYGFTNSAGSYNGSYWVSSCNNVLGGAGWYDIIAIDSDITFPGGTTTIQMDYDLGAANSTGDNGAEMHIDGSTVASAAMSIGNHQVLTYTGTISAGVHNVWVRALASENASNDGICDGSNGNGHIRGVYINATAPPSSDLTLVYDLCPELGNDVAIFTDPSKWGPGLTNPTGETKGLLLTNKRASIQVLILPDHKYKIKLIYHETVASDPSQFTVQLADAPFMFVQLDGTTDSQVYLSPEANYTPDNLDHANFAIASQLYVTGVPVLGRDLIIDYACLFDTEPNRLGSTGDDPNGHSQEACSYVVFQGTSDFLENARRLIAWLWAGLKSLFDCVLRPLLAAIWSSLSNGLSATIRFLLQLSTWLSAQAPIVFAWIGNSLGNLWRWLVGMLGNLLQIVLNGAAVLLNNLGLSGLVNGIIAFLSSLPQFLESAVHIAVIVFEIVVNLATRLFQLILSVIGLIPIVVNAIITSFNNSSSIPFWAPSCSSSNTILAGPCLGFYIIDNTIFDGPIFYIFILIDGLVAINTLLWAVERVKKALTA